MSSLLIKASSLLIAATATASAAFTTPHFESFSGATETLEASATHSITHNGITYSVDGNGRMGFFNLAEYLAADFENLAGLGILGDFSWTGNTTNNVHNFTLSTSEGTPFRLASLDAVTGNSGPPTVFTITAYKGNEPTAQVTNLDLATLAATFYAPLTSNSVESVDIGPKDGSGFGQSLVFTGSGWQSVDRIVFTTTGNDLLLGLDNIQFANPIPEPSALMISAFGLLGTLALRRRH
jgi:hypothetical protein